jgi:serine/threonine protein kinase
VIHRDVKPSNILLTDADFAYLVDFGIAHAAGDVSLTETGTTVGTFGYLAPERLEGRTADARADVYSLTCVLYELLVGERPFADRVSTSSLIQAHLHEIPPAPSRVDPSLPAGFDELVRRGMAKDPEQRYPSVAALVADLQQVPIPAHPPASTGRIR